MVDTRVPPHNNDAERSLLGAILLQPDVMVDVLPVLDRDDFYNSQAAMIFEACVKVHEDGSRADATMVRDRLHKDGNLDKIGGDGSLAKLIDAVPSAAGALDYASVIRAHSIRRNVIHAAAELTSEAHGGADVDALLALADERLLGMKVQSEGEAQSLGDLVSEALADVEAAFNGTALVPGVDTGLADLDRATGGLTGGDFIVVAGRPSMGKSTFALNIADNVAESTGEPVLFCSIEVVSSNVVKNVLARRAKVNAMDLHSRSPTLTGEEFDRVKAAAEEIKGVPLWVDDDGSLTPQSLRATATRLKAAHGLALVVVDYIQLMDVPGKTENRQLEIAKISRDLKRLAKTLDVPVIALAQLNRQVENREDKRPRLSDLRESGTLEQDADMVLLLYRDEYYRPETDDKNIAEVHIAKQRTGPTERVRLYFEPEYLSFSNLSAGDPRVPVPVVDDDDDRNDPYEEWFS